MIKSRKLKIVSIDEAMVFDWFVQASRSWTSSAQLLDLPMISVMPPDYQVLEVRHEPFRKAFAFLVQSESFDDVYMGQEIPGMIAVTRYESVEIRQPRYPDADLKEEILKAAASQNDRTNIIIPRHQPTCNVPVDAKFECGGCHEMKLVADCRRIDEKGFGWCSGCGKWQPKPCPASTADLEMRDRFGHPLVYDHSKPGVPVESIEWPTIGRFGTSDLIAGMKHAIVRAEEGCDKPLILK